MLCLEINENALRDSLQRPCNEVSRELFTRAFGKSPFARQHNALNFWLREDIFPLWCLTLFDSISFCLQWVEAGPNGLNGLRAVQSVVRVTNEEIECVTIRHRGGEVPCVKDLTLKGQNVLLLVLVSSCQYYTKNRAFALYKTLLQMEWQCLLYLWSLTMKVN